MLDELTDDLLDLTAHEVGHALPRLAMTLTICSCTTCCACIAYCG